MPTDLQGRPRLRAAIAKHVSFARAVACQPDDIVVTTGTRQSVDLLSRILVTAGETQVAIEDPCFPPLRLAFLAAGARVHPVPVDEEGLVVERLPADARVICVSPSHQYPLGVAMSARRRAALLEFARTNGAVIVEDDYDSEFRLDGRPLDALQTLDRDQTVFYIGTFSKSLFIGPRVGFVATPPWARRALVSAKHTFDGSNPVLTQETLASFIAEGHLARHIRKMRKIYSERHALLLAALTRHCKDRVHPISAFAGVHVAAELTGTMSAEEICARALDVGIRLDPIDRYAFRQGAQTGLVFGYGMIGSGDIEPAIGELARVIEAC